MGTHAMIGVWDEETGKVTASYVHYDGYVDGVGETLVKHYNTPFMAEVVSTGGYLSALYENYDRSRHESVHNDSAVSYNSVEAYLEEAWYYASAHYIYLWDGENWFYASAKNKIFEEVEMNLGGGK